jgi:hypothetical protein
VNWRHEAQERSFLMTRTRPARFAPFVLIATLVATAILPLAQAATPSAELEADLIHMVAEEKLAHDVYLALDALYDVPEFANVAASEARHVEAVRGLLSAYGVEDPTLGDAAGAFDDATFQAMHDDLVAQGSASLEAAAAVGVAIEEIDIADLEAALARGLPADAERVFANLLAGSEHHLAAFSALQDAAAQGAASPATARGNGFGRRGGGD